MATTAIIIQIDEVTKQKAEELFSSLGLTLNSAINMFLKKAIEVNDIPFEYYNDETIQALLESRSISHDPNTKRYNDLSEVFKELDEET